LKNEVSEEFNLKAELKSIGMTQKDFAEYVEINQNTVSRWVRGDLPLPKWVERLIENYKKAQILDNMQKIYIR
jgi:transcriptional regulator with XRE-family HTH domain